MADMTRRGFFMSLSGVGVAVAGHALAGEEAVRAPRRADQPPPQPDKFWRRMDELLEAKAASCPRWWAGRIPRGGVA